MQICAFLGLPTKTNERKAILVKQLRALLEADQRAKARFFEVFAQELAVEPWELETLLGCSTTERKRWVADGKLTPLTTRSVFKSGMELFYPVFDRRSIQHSLPHVTQTEQEDGLFRFGRRLEEGEKILYREKDVETQFTQALSEARRRFLSVEPSSYSEKEPGKDSDEK